MAPLKRTDSLLFLPTPPHPPLFPTRGRHPRSTSHCHAPSKIIFPSVASPITTILTPRSSSPLSPRQVPISGRPVFPRTKKPEPDLYRMAIRMRMLLSPQGQKILNLGPRLAMQLDLGVVDNVKVEADRTRRDIVHVTRELESMVRDIFKDEDVLMSEPPHSNPTTPASPAPPVLTTSWVLVKGEDWEMITA